MRHTWLLLAVLQSACELPLSAPFRPYGEPYDPPAAYGAWWAQVVDCVGAAPTDMGRIRWFEVGGPSFDTPDHGRALARWVPPHDIYIAEAHVESEPVVRHEMVHDLLRGGDAADPRFLACSGIGH